MICFCIMKSLHHRAEVPGMEVSVSLKKTNSYLIGINKHLGKHLKILSLQKGYLVGLKTCLGPYFSLTRINSRS